MDAIKVKLVPGKAGFPRQLKENTFYFIDRKSIYVYNGNVFGDVYTSKARIGLMSLKYFTCIERKDYHVIQHQS